MLRHGVQYCFQLINCFFGFRPNLGRLPTCKAYVTPAFPEPHHADNPKRRAVDAFPEPKIIGNKKLTFAKLRVNFTKCRGGHVHQAVNVTRNGNFRATHGNPNIKWSAKNCTRILAEIK